MTTDPFGLRRYDATDWKFTWYEANRTRKWDIEDLFLDGEMVYIGPADENIKLIGILKTQKKLNINWERKTISYKGRVDVFETWGEKAA